jgi:hypothetical protein
MLSNRKTKKMLVMNPITKNKVARKKVIAMTGKGNYQRGHWLEQISRILGGIEDISVISNSLP